MNKRDFDETYWIGGFEAEAYNKLHKDLCIAVPLHTYRIAVECNAYVTMFGAYFDVYGIVNLVKFVYVEVFNTASGLLVFIVYRKLYFAVASCNLYVHNAQITTEK